MFHKTNGTNGKVVPQGFILAQKKIVFHPRPGKKIDFSLEVHKTEISQMNLLSTMRQCDFKAYRLPIPAIFPPFQSNVSMITFFLVDKIIFEIIVKIYSK